jgi:hypothetical protein
LASGRLGTGFTGDAAGSEPPTAAARTGTTSKGVVTSNAMAITNARNRRVRRRETDGTGARAVPKASAPVTIAAFSRTANPRTISPP